MKRILTVLSFMLALMSVNANEEGHFFVDLSSQNVALTNIDNSFGSHFSFASGSTFTLFRDTTDALGIRHQSYQQYYQGKKVESHIVIVHSQNGKVRCINGSAMTQSQAPQSVVARISRRQAASKAPVVIDESNVAAVIICYDGVYYNAYKVLSPETLEILYIDANTGDIIYRESAFRNADVAGRGYTRYKGWQNMTVYENDGKYFLMDHSRNIATLSAESSSPNTGYYLNSDYLANNIPAEIIAVFDKLGQAEQQEIINQYVRSPMMTDYIQNSCTSLYSEETDFYVPRIKSITISSAASSWWYDVWDTKPDLYCKICDPNGNVLYTTSTKEDCTLPVTFTFTKGIAVTKDCTIKIYDEDATSDSYGGSVTLTSTTPGTKTWSGSNTSGSIVIEASPMEYSDIHWGMQKTLDFYQTQFGRNSFDGNGHIVINLAFPPYDKVMFNSMPNNAAAQCSFEPFYMYYGWGDGSLMNPVVSLDVMAHEFTHMVTGTNGNGGLVYQLESGALNESFSDIMAMGAMQFAYGSCSWTIGADIMIGKPNLRSMSDPNNSKGAAGDTTKGAQPDTYTGKCWSHIPPAKDTLAVFVHRNSGVQNYWFYLLSEGGSGTNDNQQSYSVSGIGMAKSLQIAFRNLIFYLSPNATFEDSRNGSIQAAIDLYGQNSQEHQSVVNAWYAVGVGDKYIDESAEPTEYYIVAKRNSGNYYFFTPNKVSGKNRLIAVDAGTSVRTNIDTIHTTDDYLWTFEDNKLKNHNGQYLACTAAKSAVMNTTGTELAMTNNSDGSITFSYMADTETRYLSLATAGNDYFVFYANTNQFTHLFMLPKGKDTTTPIPTIETTPQTQKLLHNGQIYILRGDKKYTITGQLIE